MRVSGLRAFRLLGGPCDGHIAELPPDGFDETWRCHDASGVTSYSEYRRDGAVFRYAGRTVTMHELAALLTEHEASATIHADSREYER